MATSPAPVLAGITLDTLPQVVLGTIEELCLDCLREGLESGGNYAGYSASRRFSLVYTGGNLNCRIIVRRTRQKADQSQSPYLVSMQIHGDGYHQNMLGAQAFVPVLTAVRRLPGYRNEANNLWFTFELPA